MILAPFGDRSCGHGGDIFGKNGPGLWGAPRFVVVWCFLLDFPFPSFPFLAPNWAPGSDFGRILGRPEPISISDRLRAAFGSMLPDFGTTFG